MFQGSFFICRIGIFEFEDLLYRRYASPHFIVEKMIRRGRFKEFVESLIRKQNEEADEKTMWELYLHKVYNKSFDEFRNELKQNSSFKRIDKEALIADIRQGLRGFKMKG